MTTEISGMHQAGNAGRDFVAKTFEQFGIFARRLTDQHVRHAVGRPFLRVQPEVRVFEGDQRRPVHGARDVRRTGVDGHDHARALQHRRPLVKGQAAQRMGDVAARFESGGLRFAFARSR